MKMNLSYSLSIIVHSHNIGDDEAVLQLLVHAGTLRTIQNFLNSSQNNWWNEYDPDNNFFWLQDANEQPQMLAAVEHIECELTMLTNTVISFTHISKNGDIQMAVEINNKSVQITAHNHILLSLQDRCAYIAALSINSYADLNKLYFPTALKSHISKYLPSSTLIIPNYFLCSTHTFHTPEEERYFLEEFDKFC